MSSAFCDVEGWAVFSTRRAMDFTFCFQDSVVTVVPSALLLVYTSPRLFTLLDKGRLQGVQSSAVYYLKLGFALAAFAIQLALLVRAVTDETWYRSSMLISSIMYLLSIVGALVLHYFEYYNMVNPSGGLLLFWLFTSLVGIFPTRSWAHESPNGLRDTDPLLRLFFVLVSALVFVLENVPKLNRSQLQRPHAAVISPQANPSPEPRSNFFARITFFWLLPLLRQGRKKPLRMNDIWNVHPKLLSYPLYLTTKARLDADEAILLQQLKEARQAETWTDPSTVPKKGKIRLFSTVLHSIGLHFLLAAIPRAFYIAVFYVRPILFSNLISFVNSYGEAARLQGISPQQPWVGFGLLIAVFVCGMLSSLFDAQFVNICYNASLKARGVFVTLIYRKALRLGSTSKQEGMGSIVNHMSTDVDRVVELIQVVHYSWSSLVELVVAFALLYGEVRFAMFASIGVVAVLVSISGACAPAVAQCHKRMMASSDRRMKLLTELVSFIKSVKLYAWETFFADRIFQARVEQLKELRRLWSWMTFLAVLLNSIPPFSIFAILTVYSGIATSEEPLDTRRIFTTITLVNMLEGPVGLVNQSLSAIFGGTVSYKRLVKFLDSEEVDDENVIRSEDVEGGLGENAVEIREGTFGWYSPDAIRDALEERKKEAEKKEKEEQKKKLKDKDEDSLDADNDKKSPQETMAKDETGDDQDPSGGSQDSMGPVLFGIDLKIKRGSLTAIVGRVGEGKSSVVGAMLGEMYRYSGKVYSYGSVAYVSQTAWILNASVRENILFGKPYDREKYLETIQACALIPDFKILVNSDKTIIGEKGINLSGGQKQRVAIARAVYANADIYIMDDPLSAVDAHVDHHIFERVLTGILANKTRILVTNGTRHLQDVDQIIVVKQGKIAQDGSYEDLLQVVDGDLFKLIQESMVTQLADRGDTSDEKDKETLVIQEQEEINMDMETDTDKDHQPNDNQDSEYSVVRQPVVQRSSSVHSKDELIELDEMDGVDQEILAEGRVGWDVYKFYLSTVGHVGIFIFLIFISVFLGIEITSQIWLQRWGNENALAAAGLRPNYSTHYWILSYFAWVTSSAIMLGLALGLCMVYMAHKASKVLHGAMLWPLIRSPMSFFDVTSSGKVVNRFSHDMNNVDVEFPLQILALLIIAMSAATIFAFCIAATPYFAIIILPLGYCYYILGGYFLVSSRELKRLDSAARSPMYAHFGETLAGLITIRAFADSERFAIQATQLLDRSQQNSYMTNATMRWLHIMLDLLSLLVICFVGILAVVQRTSVSAGIFSIVLSQIGSLTSVMGGLLTLICELETSIVSVERVREYSLLVSEAPEEIPDSSLDPAWPAQGEIKFDHFATRYRDGLDLVLKELDVAIKPGEKVGIVGRTGAGKSSVTLSLFRIIEASEGTISIDGVDISKMGLRDLRSRLAIIPQDPFLFGDTIRNNLDPFRKHTDSELWTALEAASLKGYVSSLTEGLSTTIENGGESMSLGQRQLMNLARAMLMRQQTRILCLDEATAAIDIETDNAIQRALRREFKECTVLTIAHRINTIMDSDRILVLDHGRVAEFDTPQALLQNKEGLFFSLASKSGHI